MTGGIELRNIRKTLQVNGEPLTVLEGLNLTVPRDGITVVLGKSGCGKTTLLRLVGGLDEDYEGEILRPQGTRTAMVFQEPRLMPWLTVEKNITFGLRRGEIDPMETAALVELTGLRGFERAKPHQLSGGMEQRTAIARALAVNPDFLLMDEPFAALDYFTRASMQQALLEIHQKNACGVLFITHSIDEALTLGDHIVILRDRQIRKVYHLTEKADPEHLTSREALDLKEDILIQLNEKEQSK